MPHPVTHPRLVRIAELHRRQWLLGLHAQQGDVAGLVTPDQFRLQGGVVLQRHRNLVRALDHVIVGHHEAGRIDDEAGPQALHPPFRRGLVTGAAALAGPVAVQEILEELLERRARREHWDVRTARRVVAGLHALRRGDVDHGRQQLGRQIGEAVRGRPRDRGHRGHQGGAGQREQGGGPEQGGTGRGGAEQAHHLEFLAIGAAYGPVARRGQRPRRERQGAVAPRAPFSR